MALYFDEWGGYSGNLIAAGRSPIRLMAFEVEETPPAAQRKILNERDGESNLIRRMIDQESGISHH